jgi:hypothetical protein
MTHDSPAAAPVRRAYQIYLYAVCFVTVLVALFAAAESAYGLFRVIAPDTTAAEFGGPISFGEDESPQLVFTGLRRSGERRRGTSQLIQWGLVGAAAGLVFRHHQRQATALRAELEALSGGSAPSETPAPGTAPPPIAADMLPASEPTRRIRRAPAKRRAPRRKT